MVQAPAINHKDCLFRLRSRELDHACSGDVVRNWRAPASVWRSVCLWICLYGLCGCSWKVIPPEVEGTPSPVLISGYSKHTRIALQIEPDTFVEFGFGDWDYYALDNTGAGSALRAAFFSKASALSRRSLPWEGDIDRFRLRAGAMRTVLIEVEEYQVSALLDTLELLWDELEEGAEAYREWEGLYLRKLNAPYHLFHNSNHKAAGWLEELGCRVTGVRLTNDFRVDVPADRQSSVSP